MSVMAETPAPPEQEVERYAYTVLPQGAGATDPSVAAGLREDLGKLIEKIGLGELVDTAQIVITELVTNAQKHAGGWEAIKLQTIESGLFLEVRDSSPEMPAIPTSVPLDADELPDLDELPESGLGLAMVARLATEVWVEKTQGGKQLCVELDRKDAS